MCWQNKCYCTQINLWQGKVLIPPKNLKVKLLDLSFFYFFFYLHIMCCTLHVYIIVIKVNIRELKRQIYKIFKSTLFQWFVVKTFSFPPMKTEIHFFPHIIKCFLSVIYNCQILFILICLLKSKLQSFKYIKRTIFTSKICISLYLF